MADLQQLLLGRPRLEERDQWYLKTDDGELYGPVDEAELREWIDEGRIDHECQLLQVGWKQWQWADEVFPELDRSNELPEIIPELIELKRRRPAPAIEFDQYGVPHVKQDDPFVEGDNPFEFDAASEAEETPNTEEITETAGRVIIETRPAVVLLAGLGAAGGAGLIWYGVTILRYAIPLEMIPLVFMGTSLVLCGVLTLWAAYRLWHVGREIAWFTKHQSSRRLQSVLVAQRAFWQLTGIVAVTAVLLGVVTAILVRMLGAPVTFY